MKNLSLNQTQHTNQIKLNRYKMRQKLKLKLNFKDNKIEKEEPLTPSTLSSYKLSNSMQNHKIDKFNKKQMIAGHFQEVYDLGQKIGQGAHATVYKCIEKCSGREYAVKITKQGDEQLLESSKNQFQILKQINHKSIMKAESFYVDRNKMTTYLVCELCHYPELAIYLRNQNSKSISESQATSIIAKIFQTLQYLHKKGICHRDIKPQNILYDPQSQNIKLIDFDCAKTKKEYQDKFEMWTKTGSLHYQAPEYFSQAVYTEKVDIWALGVIAYELVAGYLPFKNNYVHRIVKMITSDQIDYESLNVSSEYKFLLRKMLEKDSEKRFSVEDCLRLPLMLKENQCEISQVFDDFKINEEKSKLTLSLSTSCTYLSLNRKNQYLDSKQEQDKKVIKYFYLVK